jgi:hypothetical protein
MGHTVLPNRRARFQSAIANLSVEALPTRTLFADALKADRNHQDYVLLPAWYEILRAISLYAGQIS